MTTTSHSSLDPQPVLTLDYQQESAAAGPREVGRLMLWFAVGCLPAVAVGLALVVLKMSPSGTWAEFFDSLNMWLSGVGLALGVLTCTLAAALWWRTSSKTRPVRPRSRLAAVACGLAYAACFWAVVITGETYDHLGFWVWMIAWGVVWLVLPPACAVFLAPSTQDRR